MTPDQPEFKYLAASVEEIKCALIGDPMKGKPGFIAGHHKLMRDLYGVDENGDSVEGHEKNTILARVSNVEDKQKKVIWVFTGIVAAVTAAKIGVSAFLDKVFSK